MKKLKTWEKLKNWKYNTYWIITFDITERIMMRWNELTMPIMMKMNGADWNKQSKVKHGFLRDLTAIVHGKYQYTRYTHTPLLQQQLKILTDRRPFELEQHLKPEVPTTDVPPNGAPPPSTRNIWIMLPRLMKSMMSPLNWQLQYVHDTAPTLTYNHLTFARNWTTLQHQEFQLTIPTYQTTLTFEYWNWTGNLLKNDLNFLQTELNHNELTLLWDRTNHWRDTYFEQTNENEHRF